MQPYVSGMCGWYASSMCGRQVKLLWPIYVASIHSRYVQQLNVAVIHCSYVKQSICSRH